MWVIWTVLSVNCGSKVGITVIFRLPAKKPLRQHDIKSQQKRNHSSDERHIGSKSASRCFSFASFHDTPRASIHPRIQSSHPTKHVNSDWARACTSRFLSALQQNRAQSRLLYLFYDKESFYFPTHLPYFQNKLHFTN